MKLILSIEPENISKINDIKQRKFVEFFISSISRYHRNYQLNKGVIPYESIAANQSYIDTLFILTDLLYQYYELSQRHFELLELAAINLKRLYEAQILSLPSENKTKKTEIKEELIDYLDKVALIFQTASDTTENKLDRKTYEAKAKEYGKQADSYRDPSQITNHLKKMQTLYENAAKKYSNRKFLEEIFLKKAIQYQDRDSAENMGFSPHTSIRPSKLESSEKQPLLSSPGSNPYGLRRRQTSFGLFESLLNRKKENHEPPSPESKSPHQPNHQKQN